MAKTINISEENHKNLSDLCKKNQTYNDLITELIKKNKNEIL